MRSLHLTGIVAGLAVCGGPTAAHGQDAGHACTTIAALVSHDSTRVGVAPDTVVRDPRGDARWRGCRVRMERPHADVVGNNAPDRVVRRGLTALGWTELPKYAADGPNGTAFALRRDGVVCFVNAGWADDAAGRYTFSAACTVP